MLHNNIWIPPKRTTASRLPPRRSAASCCGSVICHRQNRELVFESLLERDFVQMAMANREVAHIQDQPPAVSFVARDGRTRKHVFDFLLTMVSGRKVAIAVKPSARLASGKLQDVVRRIAASDSGKRFADEFRILTEREITRSRAENARLILRARLLRNEEDVRRLARHASSHIGPVRVAELLAAYQPFGRGFNALVNLVDEGVVKLVSKGVLGRASEVVWKGR